MKNEKIEMNMSKKEVLVQYTKIIQATFLIGLNIISVVILYKILEIVNEILNVLK